MPLPPVEDISSLLEIDSNLKEWQDVDSFLEWHQQQLVKNKADKKYTQVYKTIQIQSVWYDLFIH